MNNFLKYIKSNKELVTIFVFVGLAVVLAIREVNKQDVVPTNNHQANFKVDVNNEQIKWEQATPGTTKLAEIQGKLADPTERTVEKKEIYYKYIDKNAKDNFQLTYEVVTDIQDTIKYINITINPYKKLSLDVYKSKYNLGEPDLIKGIEEVATHEAYVYLKKGLMLYVRVDDKSVRNEIYFTPTTEGQFMADWKDKLTKEYDVISPDVYIFN